MDEQGKGAFTFPMFIVVVGGFIHMEKDYQFILCQIMNFPEITDIQRFQAAYLS